MSKVTYFDELRILLMKVGTCLGTYFIKKCGPYLPLAPFPWLTGAPFTLIGLPSAVHFSSIIPT